MTRGGTAHARKVPETPLAWPPSSALLHHCPAGLTSTGALFTMATANPSPSFFTRFGLAFSLFFRVLFNALFAEIGRAHV